MQFLLDLNQNINFFNCANANGIVFNLKFPLLLCWYIENGLTFLKQFLNTEVHTIKCTRAAYILMNFDMCIHSGNCHLDHLRGSQERLSKTDRSRNGRSTILCKAIEVSNKRIKNEMYLAVVTVEKCK